MGGKIIKNKTKTHNLVTKIIKKKKKKKQHVPTTSLSTNIQQWGKGATGVWPLL